jgi:hypothetical protein
MGHVDEQSKAWEVARRDDICQLMIKVTIGSLIALDPLLYHIPVLPTWLTSLH